MSISVCVRGLVAEGRLTEGQAFEAERLYSAHFNALKQQMGMMPAAALASERAIAQLRAQLNRRKLLAAQSIQTRQRIEGELANYGGGNLEGPIDPRAGPALLGGDGRATYSNVDGRMRAIRARAHAQMDGILAKHSSNILGEVRGRAELRDMVRELFGEDSGNANARELSGAWTDTAEMLRQRFNAAGGDIGKLDHWGLPQSHDARQVRAAGYSVWSAEILPRLDRERMIDRDTGLPFSNEKLEAALQDVFETIRSDGWTGRSAGAAAGKGALANRRGESRFLVFKSADDWMAYAERFGAGNAFDGMMGHIDGMARDTAMMEILGPNPDSTLRWLKDTIEKSAAEDRAPDSKAVDRAFKATKKINRLHNEITGAINRPENRALSLTFSALRSYQTATKLGGAMLSAVTDLGFHFSARKYNGLPAASMLRDYVKLMRPGAVEDQKLAVRLGLIAEEWSNRTATQGRYLTEELTGEVSRRLAEGVLRASGLARFTQAGRWAFGMQMIGHITDESGKRFDALDPAFRGLLERYGMGADAWDQIRATPHEIDRGVPWIKPANVENGALGDRLLEMIGRETDFAVPVPDINTRSLVNSVAPKGSWHGEIIRSALLFKSFGISVMLMQTERIMAQAGANRLRYMAGLAISTTLMGALSIQLKDIFAGRDPRSMRDPSFWGQAGLQGGGGGIYGDFLRSVENRAGGGIAGTVAGPIASDIQDIAGIATSNNPAGAALKTLRRQLPGGTLWYARLAFDRQVGDQLQEAIDPEYRKSWRRSAKWAQEQGTDFWWAPGDLTPERAPDMSNPINGASHDTSGQGAFAP